MNKKVFCIGIFKSGLHSILQTISSLHENNNIKVKLYNNGWNDFKIPPPWDVQYFNMDVSFWNKFCDTHMNQIKKIIDDNDVFADIPFLFMYEKLLQWYPNAQFVLTCRNVQDIVRSDLQMWITDGLTEKYEVENKEEWVVNEQSKTLKSRYINHQDMVERFFENNKRSDQLLKIDLTETNAIQKLCNFLNINGSVLEKPLHMNESPKLAVLIAMKCDKMSLNNIEQLAQSIHCDPLANIQIYFGYDQHDSGFDNDCQEKLQSIFNGQISFVKFPFIINIDEPYPICQAWRYLTKFAYDDKANPCEWFVFLGDDIILKEYWFEEMLRGFQKNKNGLDKLDTKYKCKSFGVVSLKEKNGPGWPTFPVVSRSHIDIFGEIFNEQFINQDADPFLFELYRRIGCSQVTSKFVLSNEHGGVSGGLYHVQEPRYKRVYVDWRSKWLPNALEKLQDKLKISNRLYITCDIIIPSYRIDMKVFHHMIEKVKIPLNMNVRWIIIIDRKIEDIDQNLLQQLQLLENNYNNIRIRVNYENKGASYTRTRGLRECHSDYVIFFDDDVYPKSNCLEELYVAIINNIDKPVNGFVGLSTLPRDNYNATNAIHMAQTTYFWEISTHLQWSPWGVTAFLGLKWKPNMTFDEEFPKTGGGEDIAFCIEHLKGDEKKIISVPTAEIIHPWWNDRQRLKLWSRLVKWAIGDGMLIDKFPQFCYSTFPNIFEFISFWWPLLCCVKYFIFFTEQNMMQIIIDIFVEFVILIAAEFIAGTIFVYYRNIEPQITGFKRFCSAFESHIARNSSEFGHWYGHMKRKRFFNIILSKRFDWFLCTLPHATTYEYSRVVLHLTCFLLVLIINFFKNM